MKTLLISALSLVAVVAVPGAAFASTYAYVNVAGEVMSTEASNPTQAIQTAPNISLHSGVMLLDSPDDSSVVGDGVGGV